MSQQLSRAIGRLEGKIDTILVNQDEFKATFSKHDDRLRKLEGQHMKALGFFGTLMVFCNWAWDLLRHKL
jgi:hypothetical protein